MQQISFRRGKRGNERRQYNWVTEAFGKGKWRGVWFFWKVEAEAPGFSLSITSALWQVATMAVRILLESHY